ncbi:MAG: hypothetical protein K0R67_1689 [Paenibacillus sp.]|nr:hypothetical protein [Paenibacillus sp.]
MFTVVAVHFCNEPSLCNKLNVSVKHIKPVELLLLLAGPTVDWDCAELECDGIYRIILSSEPFMQNKNVTSEVIDHGLRRVQVALQRRHLYVRLRVES